MSHEVVGRWKGNQKVKTLKHFFLAQNRNEMISWRRPAETPFDRARHRYIAWLESDSFNFWFHGQRFRAVCNSQATATAGSGMLRNEERIVENGFWVERKSTLIIDQIEKKPHCLSIRPPTTYFPISFFFLSDECISRLTDLLSELAWNRSKIFTSICCKKKPIKNVYDDNCCMWFCVFTFDMLFYFSENNNNKSTIDMSMLYEERVCILCFCYYYFLAPELISSFSLRMKCSWVLEKQAHFVVRRKKTEQCLHTHMWHEQSVSGYLSSCLHFT